jgi:hypothetical protein
MYRKDEDTMIVRTGNLLILCSVAAFVVATAWWIAFFHEVLGDRFQLARECFYWNADLCALKTPAGLFVDVPVYNPALLWVTGALFVGGLAVRCTGWPGASPFPPGTTG